MRIELWKVIVVVLLNALLLTLIAQGCAEPTAEAPEPTIAHNSEPPIPQITSAPEEETQPPVKPQVPDGGYTLVVEDVNLEGSQLRATFATNIPGTIELMASLNLAGQKPDDLYIGTNERVTLRDGAGAVTFDTSDLPSGQYEVEASFYPRWGLKDRISQSTGIADDLEATRAISIAGSGKSAAAELAKKNGQAWVMENVIIGTPWRPAEWRRRFGESQQLKVDRYNPEIIKAYYFPSIDTTVLVNTLKKEVSIWRFGRATH